MPSQPPAAGRIDVYTDGGARPNPGPGGWGAVVIDPGGGVRELSGAEPHTTNNRMELTAAIRALEALPAGARVRLTTDSQYLRRGVREWLAGWIARGWTRKGGGRVENEDLWRLLGEVAGGHAVEWAWVKGHAGHRWNERADVLATAARRRIEGGPRGGKRSGSGASSGSIAEPDAEVFLRVSGGPRGGWAARVVPRAVASGEERVLAGRRAGASSSRLDLEAAAAALESLPPGASAAIWTGSDYLRRGATAWLADWKRGGWRTRSGGAVKNRDAWERLEAAMAGRRIDWREPDEAAAARIAELVPGGR